MAPPLFPGTSRNNSSPSANWARPPIRRSPPRAARARRAARSCSRAATGGSFPDRPAVRRRSGRGLARRHGRLRKKRRARGREQHAVERLDRVERQAAGVHEIDGRRRDNPTAEAIVRPSIDEARAGDSCPAERPHRRGRPCGRRDARARRSTAEGRSRVRGSPARRCRSPRMRSPRRNAPPGYRSRGRAIGESHHEAVRIDTWNGVASSRPGFHRRPPTERWLDLGSTHGVDDQRHGPRISRSDGRGQAGGDG